MLRSFWNEGKSFTWHWCSFEYEWMFLPSLSCLLMSLNSRSRSVGNFRALQGLLSNMHKTHNTSKMHTTDSKLRVIYPINIKMNRSFPKPAIWYAEANQCLDWFLLIWICWIWLCHSFFPKITSSLRLCTVNY